MDNVIFDIRKKIKSNRPAIATAVIDKHGRLIDIIKNTTPASLEKVTRQKGVAKVIFVIYQHKPMDINVESFKRTFSKLKIWVPAEYYAIIDGFPSYSVMRFKSNAGV